MLLPWSDLAWECRYSQISLVLGITTSWLWHGPLQQVLLSDEHRGRLLVNTLWFWKELLLWIYIVLNGSQRPGFLGRNRQLRGVRVAQLETWFKCCTFRFALDRIRYQCLTELRIHWFGSGCWPWELYRSRKKCNLFSCSSSSRYRIIILYRFYPWQSSN